jgi:hypothetical protein
MKIFNKFVLLTNPQEMVAAGSARINGIPPNPNVWQTTKINRQSRVIFTKQPQNVSGFFLLIF